MPDPGFLLRLLVAGGVIAAVLLQVAFLAAGIDLRREDRAVSDEVVELLLEAVVGVLGQPSHDCAGHGNSSLLQISCAAPGIR